MKEIIREEDIESVILSDESAVCVYTKMKDTMTYATSYSYRTLEEGGKTFAGCAISIQKKEMRFVLHVKGIIWILYLIRRCLDLLWI